MPYNVGVQLGASGEEQRFSVTLAGNLASAETKGLLVLAKIGDFEPVQLAFAWTRVNNIPILLGRTIFLLNSMFVFMGHN